MLNQSGELATGRDGSAAGSLADERRKGSEETTHRLRTLPPELLAAVMQAVSSALDANEARAEEGIELATQIVNGMTLPEIHTVEALQLHMRQCDALAALKNYRNARDELRMAVKYLMRRCVRTLGNQLATGAISADVA